MSKRAALLLIVILTMSSLIVVKAATALAPIPKPSIPEFTLEYVDNSYDVPPTFGIDPYTGKNVTTKAGYHVENKSIIVYIKSQPFTSYYDNGTPILLYYNIRFKGHFQEFWYIVYQSPNFLTPKYQEDNSLAQTEVLFPVGNTTLIGEIPVGGQVDFQVQAMIGYYTEVVHEDIPPPWNTEKVFTGETSEWSNTQTLSIPASTSSPPSTSSPDQTTEPTPKQTLQTIQLGAIIGTIIAVVAVGAVLLVYFRKRKNPKVDAED